MPLIETSTIHGERVVCKRLFESIFEFKAWLDRHPNVEIYINGSWHKPYCDASVDYLTDVMPMVIK